MRLRKQSKVGLSTVLNQHHLRTLRVERRLTLKQVSEGTGLSISTLHAIEKQQREVTLITAFKLARFYGLPVAHIWQPMFQQIATGGD